MHGGLREPHSEVHTNTTILQQLLQHTLLQHTHTANSDALFFADGKSLQEGRERESLGATAVC